MTVNGAAVCTVGEGSYHFGAAALCNSLVRHGYRGRAWIGWRGELPPWAAGAVAAGGGVWKEMAVEGGLTVCFVPLETSWNPANFKPIFMRRVLDELAPEASGVIYFDADIVICCRWSFFEEWLQHGVALVQDMWDPGMLPTHVFKKRWRAHAERLGYACRDVPGFYNSGFVGVRREDAEFLAIWEAITRSIPDTGGDMSRLRLPDRNHIFYQMDQSALNAAVLASSAEIATGGQEMMEIYAWGEVMAHCMHFQKPWKRNYVWDALQGFPPGRPHLAHWQNVGGPIRSYSDWKLARRRAELWIARAIGKVHHRSLLY